MNPITKFGGSTFADPTNYGRIADHLLERVGQSGSPAVAVASARPGVTERLREQLGQVANAASARTTARLLITADLESCLLLQAAVEDRGGSARVLAGSEGGVVTDDRWMWARITGLQREPYDHALQHHDVVIVPGGQARTIDGEPTWMGKNSSDLSVVALGAALGADAVDIYSDVDGVYSADPRLIPEAFRLNKLDFGTAVSAASRGAKVLHLRSIALARRHDIAVRCRLNSGAFGVGTVLDQAGSAGSLVVVDLKSTLIEYADARSADAAHAALSEAGIATVRPSDVDGHIVVVVGGYVDIGRSLREIDSIGRVREGRLVSYIHGTSARSFIADSDEEAIELGRELHDRIDRAVSASGPSDARTSPSLPLYPHPTSDVKNTVVAPYERRPASCPITHQPKGNLS